MIEITGVNHRIGGRHVLHDITASLPTGKITALIGPNGAGKSTLLSLVGRITRLESGRITVDGLDVTRCESHRIALKLAILGQNARAANRLRLRELVGFGRWPHCRGRPGEADRTAVEAALAAFDLLPIAERFLDEVSGGQAQRAWLAMTVAQDTEWLLLDEPLAALDPGHGRRLMAGLRQLAYIRGRGIVVVVHDLNQAAQWADHVVAMKDGRIAHAGDTREVLSEQVLSDLYDCPLRVIEHEGRPLVLT